MSFVFKLLTWVRFMHATKSHYQPKVVLCLKWNELVVLDSWERASSSMQSILPSGFFTARSRDSPFFTSPSCHQIFWEACWELDWQCAARGLFPARSFWSGASLWGLIKAGHRLRCFEEPWQPEITKKWRLRKFHWREHSVLWVNIISVASTASF